MMKISHLSWVFWLVAVGWMWVPISLIRFQSLAHESHQTQVVRLLSADLRDTHVVQRSELLNVAVPPPLPSFVLHVGPLKTATTSLQCAFTSLRPELEADRYRYIGRFEDPCMPPSASKADDQLRKREEKVFEDALLWGARCHKALGKLEPPPENSTESVGNDLGPGPISSYGCWGNFVSVLEKYRSNGTSIIYSEENISTNMVKDRINFPYRHLRRALTGWNVQVLVVHRRLFDWMPSAHNELYKPGPAKQRLKRWPGGGLCVNKGGKDAPTVMNNVAQMVSKPEGKKWPDTLQVVDAAQSAGLHVVLESYEGAGVVSRAVGNLPGGGAPTACRAIASGRLDTLPRGNPSVSLHHDMLTVAACRAGAVNGTVVTRTEVRDYVRERLEDADGMSPLSLPLDCPGKE
eukprot:CAMPEP_0194297012 /NCGR_PEP_ID=MMETSP0169-20130528/57735_1 /TAXON_ID=218684 /ORGANISM="Corethron pennatum, Strain L29A3" /LENGTH=405 /DNA_ID=CAMNT_0039046681 /DNA_START=101 /DNA_END=1315 /DNA_ORIENTATION=-